RTAVVGAPAFDLLAVIRADVSVGGRVPSRDRLSPARCWFGRDLLSPHARGRTVRSERTGARELGATLCNLLLPRRVGALEADRLEFDPLLSVDRRRRRFGQWIRRAGRPEVVPGYLGVLHHLGRRGVLGGYRIGPGPQVMDLDGRGLGRTARG